MNTYIPSTDQLEKTYKKPKEEAEAFIYEPSNANEENRCTEIRETTATV